MEDLIKIFQQANEMFLKQEIENICMDASEPCLCHCLANCLKFNLLDTEYADYYVDIEYNRNFGGKVKTISVKNDDNFVTVKIKADLVVHGRGEKGAKENILALEMKKAYRSQEEKDKDRQRLIALTSIPNENVWSADDSTFPEQGCGYLLGVYYEIDKRNREILIEYYEKGCQTNSYKRNF